MFVVGFVCLVMTSCAVSVPEKQIPLVMPVEPEWQTYTRAPVVTIVEVENRKNYVVSDEFVTKAGQQQDYISRIKKWKVQNMIP